MADNDVPREPSVEDVVVSLRLRASGYRALMGEGVRLNGRVQLRPEPGGALALVLRSPDPPGPDWPEPVPANEYAVEWQRGRGQQ